MITSVIIDDEPKNIHILRKMLNEFCPEINITGEAKDALQAVDIIRNYKPQLVFLDIEMPYGNAFDILDQLMPVNFEVIFITAFNNYALKAFRYSALDYLLKPINIQELHSAVNKASEKILSKNTNLQLKNLIQNIKNKNEALRKIAFPAKDGLIFIPLCDIIRLEASGSYTHVFIKDNERVLSSKSIKEYEELLPDSLFFRVHHSHIINLLEIKKYHKGRGGQVEMSDNTFIDVAVRRKDEFLSKMS
ncbi:MAG TPA: LytTR family DNA-binding domain-containing protein [Puia sp.]|nr:LytTR family DNA-binding domain-containing protein [Puia sp.]